MYKVIISDDEESIRNRLLSMVEKFRDDFVVVGVYENGYDALESGVPLEPDVIITDIRMPYVSGIELIKQAKMELPLVKSLIVSGYDSFDYAKEAIGLGVSGYLTKPIMFEEFKENLLKIKALLDSELNSNENLKELQDRAESTLHVLQNEDFQRLVTMKTVSESMRGKLTEDRINLNKKYQCMVIFDPDDFNAQLDEADAFRLSLMQYAEEEFQDVYTYYIFTCENQFVLFLESDEEIYSEELDNILSSILTRIKRNHGVSISCGVSDLMKVGEGINYRKMYRHAKRALEYRTVMGENLVLCFTDLENSSSDEKAGRIDENEYKNLSYMISYGKKQDILDQIRSLCTTICSPKYKDNYYFILSNILDAMLKSCISLPQLYSDFESQVEITKNLYSLKTREQLIEYLDDIVETILKINESKRLSGLEFSFMRIKKYLEVNYSNSSLCIEDVANELAYSVSYISAILKKNGTSFTKLVTELRMNKAVQLLANGENRIITIAKEVGYSDPYYFSHCFKKFNGMSPDEYRKNKANSQCEFARPISVGDDHRFYILFCHHVDNYHDDLYS